MTVFRTPIYGIAYYDDLQPLTDLDQVSQEVATTLETALARGGVAPPAAQDLVALAGRVTSLEQRVAARCTVTGASQTTAHQTPKPLVFSARPAKSRADMWAAGTGNATATRLVAPFTGEYDLSVAIAWVANANNQRTLGYRINGAGLVFFHSWNAQGGAYGGEQTGLVEGITLTAGQYVEVLAQQNTGANLDTGPVRATLKAALL
jgi:hypothetical protein